MISKIEQELAHELELGPGLADELELEQESSQEWLEYELSEVSLGDKRLDWRLLDTASKLAALPGV